ncbi:ComEC family competence protein [Patescibacteria group bacterium]|nr:ComEC family competence protein [Patescibacteria group bacterium]
MTKSKILLYLCLLYIAGVFVYFLVESPQPFLFEQTDQETILKGIIIGEPEQRINQQKFQVKADGIEGKILITTELYPEYNYGDELEIKGKLQEPASFEDFDYKEYLRKDKIYSVAYYPQINLLAQNQGNWLYRKIFNFKDKLRTVIDQALLPPQSSVLKAVFLGDKYGLSDNLKEKLNITGARHIVAISGMHMIIVSQILLFLGLAIGLWRQQVFYFVVILLILYIIMIGAPASAVRAGIMAGMLLLAQKVGRLRVAGRAIVFAATTMLLFNPLLLKSDAGFQLSFLATLSIVYLKPIFDNWTQKWTNPYGLKDILTMTLAAQLGTLPLLIFHFGRLSLISPVANLMIVPFLPVIMLAGMALSFSGLFWPLLAKIVAWPAWLLLSYIIKTIEYLSSIPWASYEIRSFSLVILAGYYLALTFLVTRCLKTKSLVT